MEEENKKTATTTTSPSVDDHDGGLVSGEGMVAVSQTQEDDDDEEEVLSPSFGGFRDESIDCAICLSPLDNNNEMGEVIELPTCGHRWHLRCIKEQLEQGQPNPAQRLVLSGCRCAKCGSVCGDHPKLRHLTRATDILQDKIDKVLREQCNIPDHHADKQSTTKALEEARRKYAIYLCSHCKEPYFGGSIVCADSVSGSEGGEIPPDERLCVACAPTRLLQQVQCRHPLEHRGYHIWKCRYCCNVATHVCYGTVHFCQSCHDRNSERVELLRRQQLRSRRQQRLSDGVAVGGGSQEPPACLAAIPCKGGNDCPFPKPSAGETHHKNGKSADCEQVYGCGWCQSNPTTAGNHHAFQEPPGSTNLLFNSSGQNHSLEGWKQLVPSSHWRVEESEVPLSPTIRTNFVSTYHWCAMSQVVPLHRFLLRRPNQLHQQRIRIEASAKYMARTDCPSIFRMELILFDRNQPDNPQPIQRQRTDVLDAPADFWDRASLIMELPVPPPTTTTSSPQYEVMIILYGKDVPFWAGYFGSKVTDCQLRVLGNPEEIEQIMISQEEIDAQVMEAAAPAQGWARRGPIQGPNNQGRRGQQVHQSWWRTSIVEIVLPVICFIILAWLIQ